MTSELCGFAGGTSRPSHLASVSYALRCVANTPTQGDRSVCPATVLVYVVDRPSRGTSCRRLPHVPAMSSSRKCRSTLYDPFCSCLRSFQQF
ncbi:unnamed protein product [Toxocara canis]|uniref:Secreted protein n=1 Tax=Toxocara canis TaxID=6265 RepID=A0A183TV37_TOXCA|nr:unnamed protein product [Toxocara canis]